MNPSEHEHQSDNHGKMNFRCADAGQKNCDWQVSGNSEDELMPKIEQHGREKHQLNMDDETKKKVRGAIHRKAA
jgi:predicted small metal-binding protein